MAESAEDRSSFQQLKKDVTCPVCADPFKYPKLLPCLHSVCTVCLNKLMRDGERVREGLKYLVSCPVCSEETELPKIGLASLPSAYFKQNIMKVCQILEVAEGKREQKCQECGQEKLASYYCSSCEFICTTCADQHSTMRSFSDHSLVFLKKENRSLDDLQSQLLSLKPFTKDGEMKCGKHGQQSLDMYCKTCKRLVCVKCTEHNHKPPNHQTNDIHNLIEEQKGDMQQYLDAVKELRSSVNATTDGLRSTKEKLEQQQKTVQDTVSNSFAELFRQLEALKLTLIEDSKKASDVQLESLSAELKLAKRKVTELDDIIKSTEESLEYTTDQELLALKRYMTTRLKELAVQKRPPGGLETIKVSPLDLPISCAEELMKVSKKHIAEYHSLSYNKTKAVGDGTRRAEVGKETSFTIQMVTESGAPCVEKQDVLVKILMPRTNLAVASSGTPGVEIGTYQVTYIPSAKGQYQISVQISGREISGSPYSVSAKPSKLDLDRPCEVCISQEWPWGVACGSNRQIYVTALYQHRVVILNKEGVVLRTVGLKGQRPGYLWSPTGIAVDTDGYIYVADGQENGRVQKFNGSGQFVNSYSNLCNPHGVMLNKKEDRLYICDKDNGNVMVLDKNLQQVGAFGELSSSSVCEGFENITGLEAPHSTAEDSEGNIYVTDSQNGVGCIHVFSFDGHHQRTIHHPSNPCFSPAGICIEDDLVYVCDSAENCLVVFRTDGELVTTCGSYGTYAGHFHSPLSVAVDLDGFLYICDHCNARVQVY